MDDHELAQAFIKVEPEAGSINIFVQEIGWSGSHTPVSTWKLAIKLNPESSSVEIDAEIHKVLNNQQYFRVCKECGERNPSGWMHSKSICQSCAEKNYNIVH